MKNKFLKKVCTLLMVGCMVVGASEKSFAATQRITIYDSTPVGYDVYTIRVSTGPADKYQQIDGMLGLKKTKYTSGSFSISKAKSVSIEASSECSGSIEAGIEFCKLSLSESNSISSSVTYTLEAGTTIEVDKSSPNGTYYAYVGAQMRKLSIKKEVCSKSHTGWKKIYVKNFKYAPVDNTAFLYVMRDSEYKSLERQFKNSIK